MSHHTAALSLEAGGAVVQGLALSSMAVDRFFGELDRKREAGVTSVEKLALRLQAARRDQAISARRAAAAESALADAQAEIALLKRALRNEQALCKGLREICGV